MLHANRNLASYAICEGVPGLLSEVLSFRNAPVSTDPRVVHPRKVPIEKGTMSTSGPLPQGPDCSGTASYAK